MRDLNLNRFNIMHYQLEPHIPHPLLPIVLGIIGVHWHLGSRNTWESSPKAERNADCLSSGSFKKNR